MKCKLTECRNKATKEMPYCSKECISKEIWKKQNKRKPIARYTKKIKPVSKKMAVELRSYSKIAKEFLVGKICPVTGRPAEEIHHIKGRSGKLLTDTKWFLGVTRQGHIWIHDNPKESMERGWMALRTN